VPFTFKGNRFDPMVDIAINPVRGVHLYGKYATGYKSGGANSRSLTYRTFAPESVSTFEVGLKTQFAGDRIRLNVAAYTSKYKDAQIDFNAIIPGVNRGTLETTNAAGNGRVKGYEIDLTVAPVTGLTLGGSYAYTKIRLPLAPNPFVTGSPLVKVFPLYTPENAASGTIDYRLPFGWGTVNFHADGNYSDGQYTSSSDPTKSDRAFLVNGRFAISDIAIGNAGTTFDVSVWARNLLNEQHAFLINGGPTPTAPKSALGAFGIFNEPRTYGVDLTMKW
jgi:iron complex outermembrane receptor protein